MTTKNTDEEGSSMGQRLKEVRKLLKASQTDFANALGQTQGIISKLEAGRMEIRVAHLQDIAKQYPFNIHYVINGEGHPLDSSFQSTGYLGIPLLVISGDESSDPFTEKAMKMSPVKLSLPYFTDCDAVIKIASGVLSPMLQKEDLAPIKRVLKFSAIQEGKPYLVVMDYLTILRTLHRHPSKPDCFVAKTNEDESIDICPDNVKHLFEVRGTIRDFSKTEH